MTQAQSDMIDRYALIDIFSITRKRPMPGRKVPRTRYGLIESVSRITGNVVPGSYGTDDGRGHVERNGSAWEAWHDDVPGITAHCATLREAAGEVQALAAQAAS